ncbi:MAG: RNA methyltransferase, partial [Bacteroidales bacterium]|nr:RNA methyltransferase [Bacteroidales bacterium]
CFFLLLHLTLKRITMAIASTYSLSDRQRILAYLLTFISENKQQKFREAVRLRTRHITIVLEDIYQPHNASAVLRSCDCFGIQDVHIIENKNNYQVNPDVAVGSAKWLTLQNYNQDQNNTPGCLTKLKNQGYQIVAATPHLDSETPESFPLDKKVALLFGTELRGLSPDALQRADQFIRIPMVGFTESLNISVSAAIILYTLTRRLRLSEIDWKLSDEEETDILISWASAMIKKPDLIIRNFMGNR